MNIFKTLAQNILPFVLRETLSHQAWTIEAYVDFLMTIALPTDTELTKDIDIEKHLQQPGVSFGFL